MGYRSNVALALTSDAAKVLRALCEHETDIRSLIDDADEKIGWGSTESDVVKLMWQNIKWYTDYDIGIQALQAFLDNTDEIEWYFLRLGEEPDDVQTEGGFWESDIYIQRTIVL